jgi:hypothetical protein
LICLALLQFEEIDNLKSPMQLTNSNISDLAAISQDDIDQFESGVPSFQAHFSVSSPTAKTNEPTRGKLTQFSIHYKINQSIQPVISIILIIFSMVCMTTISSYIIGGNT